MTTLCRELDTSFGPHTVLWGEASMWSNQTNSYATLWAAAISRDNEGSAETGCVYRLHRSGKNRSPGEYRSMQGRRASRAVQEGIEVSVCPSNVPLSVDSEDRTFWGLLMRVVLENLGMHFPQNAELP